MIVVLTRRGQLYRFTAAQNQLGATMTVVVPDLAFEVVPISDMDTRLPFALEATHVLWVPRWLNVLKEDEVRYGSYINTAGVAQPYRYVVNGRRAFKTGFRQTSYYVTERE